MRSIVAFLSLCVSLGTVHAMDLKLAGKQALVTGSTSGIGFAIAKSLLEEGADVIVNGRSQETVDAAIASLREATGKTAKGFAADMSTADGTNAIHAAFPSVEILVNNVGGYGPQPFEQSTDEGLVPAHRPQRDERRAVVATLPARNAHSQLGADHLHLERERLPHTAR